MSGGDPQNNHDSNKENILAQHAVAEMMNKIGEVSVTMIFVIYSLNIHLQLVLVVLPMKRLIKRTFQQKRHKIQFKSDSKPFPLPPKVMTFHIPEEFQHMILHDS